MSTPASRAVSVVLTASAVLLVVLVVGFVANNQTEDSGVKMCRTMAEEFPKRARLAQADIVSVDEYNDLRRGFQDSHIPDIQESGVAFVDLTYTAAVDDPAKIPMYSSYVVAAYSRMSTACKTYAGISLPDLAELNEIRRQHAK